MFEACFIYKHITLPLDIYMSLEELVKIIMRHALVDYSVKSRHYFTELTVASMILQLEFKAHF